MLAVAGTKHVHLLGRTGRAEVADGPLESVVKAGWAACVTMTKCDLAYAEDSSAILENHKHLGRDARIS